MNKDLARMLSEEVLKLKEQSNGTLTINQALDKIVLAYKKSQGLENKTNLILHYKDFVFKVGDKFKHTENGVVGTIIGIDNNNINISQYHDVYGYYPNVCVSVDSLGYLLKMKVIEKIRVGD